MKKGFAGFLIALFSLLIVEQPRTAQLYPAKDAAEAFGQTVGLVLLVGFLFFSVRWYIKLSGHSYHISRQAWAVILLWCSVIATAVGVAMIPMVSVTFGEFIVAIWACVGFACWKWRQRLRRTEVILSTVPAVTAH